MINRVVLVGRLTKEPELITTPSRKCVCSFTIAVNRRTHQEGKPDTDFINCVAWNKTADNMASYLHKGSLIGVEGRIQTRSYDNQQGNKVYVTEVLCDSVAFLEHKRSVEAQEANKASNASGMQNQEYKEPKTKPQEQQIQYAVNLTAQAEMDTLDISPDDLPF